MIQISNAEFEQLIRIFRVLERCRGSTNKEINALRKMKLMHRKWERKVNRMKYKTLTCPED